MLIDKYLVISSSFCVYMIMCLLVGYFVFVHVIRTYSFVFVCVWQPPRFLIISAHQHSQFHVFIVIITVLSTYIHSVQYYHHLIFAYYNNSINPPSLTTPLRVLITACEKECISTTEESMNFPTQSSMPYASQHTSPMAQPGNPPSWLPPPSPTPYAAPSMCVYIYLYIHNMYIYR